MNVIASNAGHLTAPVRARIPYAVSPSQWLLDWISGCTDHLKNRDWPAPPIAGSERHSGDNLPRRVRSLPSVSLQETVLEKFRQARPATGLI